MKWKSGHIKGTTPQNKYMKTVNCLPEMYLVGSQRKPAMQSSVSSFSHGISGLLPGMPLESDGGHCAEYSLFVL